jgi:hypothetical protein
MSTNNDRAARSPGHNANDIPGFGAFHWLFRKMLLVATGRRKQLLQLGGALAVTSFILQESVLDYRTGHRLVADSLSGGELRKCKKNPAK